MFIRSKKREREDDIDLVSIFTTPFTVNLNDSSEYDIYYSQKNSKIGKKHKLFENTNFTFQEELNNKIFLSCFWKIAFDPQTLSTPINTTIFEKRTGYAFNLSFGKNKANPRYFNFIFSNADNMKSSFSLYSNHHFEITVDIYFQNDLNKKCNFILINEPSTHIEKLYFQTISELYNDISLNALEEDENIYTLDIKVIVFKISVDIGSISSVISPYSGLINEGSTCYLNSLVQMLYMIPLFSKHILSYRSGINTKLSSLQKLFTELNEAKTSIGTTPLTPISAEGLISSFNWSRQQRKVQHDFQEFFINLAEIIESEIKKSPSTSSSTDSYDSNEPINKCNIFKYLFEGKILTTIECVNHPISSSKEETFADIQLVVKGCLDIYESLENFTMSEMLSGANKYETGVYGKQEAKKSVKFSNLPRIFLIQLKRFEYNISYNEMEKINDKFKYYSVIDVGRFSKTPNNFCTKYHCFTVINHSGSINSGHYYAFIRNKYKQWYKFNDENVDRAYDYEVFDNNFGGDTLNYTFNETSKEIKGHKCGLNSNAYILMYVREDCIDEIYYEKIKEEKAKFDLSNNCFSRIILNAGKKIKVFLISKEIVLDSKGFGLFFNENNSFESIQDTLVCLDGIGYYDSVGQVVEKISSETFIPSTLLDLYLFSNPCANVQHHLKYLPKNEYTKLSLKTMIQNDSICFYVHVTQEGCSLMTFDETNKIWILNKSQLLPKNKAIEPEKNKLDKKKLVLLKYVTITFFPSKKCLESHLIVDSIYSIPGSTKECDFLKKDVLKKRFFDKYFNSNKYNYNIMIEPESFSANNINYLVENANSNNNLTQLFDSSRGLNYWTNDLICMIVNINFNSTWNDIPYIKFDSFQEVIEEKYNLTMSKNISIYKSTGYTLNKNIEFDQLHFNKQLLLDKLKIKEIKEGHFYFIAYNKIKNYIYEIYLDDNLQEFQKAINKNLISYELICKYSPTKIKKFGKFKIFVSFYRINSKEPFTLPIVLFYPKSTTMLEIKLALVEYVRSVHVLEKVYINVYNTYLDNDTLFKREKIINFEEKIEKYFSDVENNYLISEVRVVKHLNGIKKTMFEPPN